MHENETLSVAIYLYNRFDEHEAIATFGEWLGEHIFSKWISYRRDMLRFICELDQENYEKLINRACSIYNGRKCKAA